MIWNIYIIKLNILYIFGKCDIKYKIKAIWLIYKLFQK